MRSMPGRDYRARFSPSPDWSVRPAKDPKRAARLSLNGRLIEHRISVYHMILRRGMIASPQWAPVLDASQATRGSPDSAEGHRPQAPCKERRSGPRGGPDPQTTMVLTDRAAWSRPRQNSEAACKGRPPDPGLPHQRVVFRSNGLPTAWLRGSRASPSEAGFAAVRRSLAQRARSGALKRSPRFEGREGFCLRYLNI